MRTRILLVLLLIGCLGAAAMIFRGQEPEKATQATIAQRDHAHKLHAQEADAETKAQIARRDEIGEQAMAAANAGNLDAATKLLEQLCKLEESIFGPNHEEMTATLGLLSEVVFANQDMPAFIDVRKRQHRLIQTLYGETDYRTQDAKRAVTDAKELAIRSPEDRDRCRNAAQLTKAAIHLDGKGQYALAIPLARQAAEIRKAVLGEQHSDYATSLNNLALLYSHTGDTARAEPMLVKAMEIRKAVLGEQHPDYADSLNSLAVLYEEMGDRLRAEPLYVQAMEIRKAVRGEQHADFANSVHNLASLYNKMGDPARAEPMFVKAIEIYKVVFGDQNPYYARALSELAVLYKEKGERARAEPMLVKAMEIRKAVFGKQHPDYAVSLNELATFYITMNSTEHDSRAERLLIEAREIWKAVHGERHPNYAICLDNLGYIYRSKGHYSRAEPLFSEAREILKAVLGEQHPDYAKNLISLAYLYEAMGQYSRAEPLCLQAMEINKAVFGEQHPHYVESLSTLAELYRKMGDPARAEPMFVKAMEIEKVVNGEQHPDYATSLHNFALLYSNMGDAARAEPMLVKAMGIRKAVLGEQHPHYADSLNNLAVLYEEMGDLERAEPMLLKAMEIRKAARGEWHLDYANSLNNLALLYNRMGDPARAEPMYVQAVEITKAAIGEEHPEIAFGMNNLALLYNKMGDPARAESMLVKAMEIRKAALGKQHPHYADSLHYLACLYDGMGDPERAEPMYVEALEIYKAVFPDQNSDYATSLNNLAVLYDKKGDAARAEPLFTEAIDISLRNLEQTASVQTESQQIVMSQSLRYRLDNSIICGLAMNPQPSAIMRQMTTWKGSVFVRLRGLRLAAADPAIADTFKALRFNTQRLSALTNVIPAPERQEAWKEQIAELTQQKDKLDTQLMRDSVAFRSAQQKVSLDDVRQAIPNDGVIVNYLEYRAGKNGRGLMATIIRRDVEPAMVPLGSVADATEAIRGWRETLGADDAARQAGLRLRKQIWEPLLPHLGDASLIFVSTDGMLGQLPFAALPGKAENSYLIEDHAIVMLPVPMLLPRMMQRPTSEPGLKTAVLMGDVDYDSAAPITPTPESKSSSQSLLAGTSLRGVREGETYAALAATGPEIDAIAKLFRDSDAVADPEIISLRGRGATESAFREVAEKTRWMHLATHGFFAAAHKKNAMSVVESERDKAGFGMLGHSGDKPRPLVGFSPGRLSGLVFAGADQWSPSKDAATTSLAAANAESLDDGIMTADEIMYMQLENVDLAVLSACETGLGATAGGEGILGLQRAFQVAGARTTVTSLWKVDDAATQALMVEFYRNLLERKLSRLESLRQAQLWLLNHPEAIAGRNLTRGTVRELKPLDPAAAKPPAPSRSLPAYWAAFQLSGDPR